MRAPGRDRTDNRPLTRRPLCRAELQGPDPRRGTRTPNLLFVREVLSAIELPAGVDAETPRPDSNGRAWVRSPLLLSSELRGGATEAAGLEPASGRARLRRSRALPYHSAMPPKTCVPACSWRGRAARRPGALSGRRGSRTPKPARATRFRDGIPRLWQSFRGGSGRDRTCTSPGKSRELCRLELRSRGECGRQGSNLRRPAFQAGALPG